MPGAIGFIGFGEAGSTLAAAIRRRGADVAAHDIDADRVAAAGFPFLPLAELVRGARCILSTVTTSAALTAARSCLPFLGQGHVYVDLNSTSPSVKIELERVIRPTGARFVEGAILGAIGVTGAATRILTGGPDGRAAAEELTALGLRVEFYSEETGKASTFKMLRGIFSKGLEALILELLLAGRRAGIEEDLWADVAAFMAAHPFDRIAENWLKTHPAACERRCHEMAQVTQTMREIGVDPLMTAATEDFFVRSCRLGLGAAFPSRPDSMEAVAAALDRRLRDPS